MDYNTYHQRLHEYSVERMTEVEESIMLDDLAPVEVENWVPLVVEGFYNVQDSARGYVYADAEYQTANDLRKLSKFFPLTDGQRDSILEAARFIEDAHYVQAEENYELNRAARRGKFDPNSL